MIENESAMPHLFQEIQKQQPLTGRQYAAVLLRVPDSGEPWLDQMIQRARLLDAAESFIEGGQVPPEQAFSYAKNCRWT